MKKLLMILSFTCLSSLVVFSQSPYPEPIGKLTVKVVDENRQPMEGIDVGFGFTHLKTSNAWGTRTGTAVNGKTNRDGIVIAESKGLNRVGISAKKEGYYNSYVNYSFQKAEDGKYQPWNPTVDIVLRKIVNPVPMYAKKAWVLTIPEENKSVGYDLFVGDWVKPYGKGEISDMAVLFKLEFDDAKKDAYKYSMEVTAGRDNDGFCPIPKESIISESSFKLPFEAPAEGYLKNILFNVDSEKNIQTQEPKGECFFIRIRTELDGNGTVSKAIFGKFILDKDNNCSLERQKGKTKCRISFIYYINPDLTRNLEESGKNLFIPEGANRYIEKYRDYL